MKASLELLAVCLVSTIVQNVAGEVDCAAPAPAVKRSQCCKFPVFYEKQNYFDCKAELGNRTGSLHDECLSTCTLKKDSVLDNDGLKKDVAIAVVNKHLSSTDAQYQTIMDSIEYCFDLANGKLDQFKTIQSKREADLVDNCSPIASFSMECGGRYLLRKCPETEWKSSEECDSLKDYYNACPYPKVE